jgi:DNA-dependent protein kinase catalytic subunit
MPGALDPWHASSSSLAPDAPAAPRVVGFGSRVLVLTSLRRPKRVTFQGSDDVSKDFLVKGGEDLRLDQRIQMLFAHMSRLFAADASCARRALRVVTYCVVPVSLSVGLIEWVPSTKTLFSICQDVAEARGPSATSGAPAEPFPYKGPFEHLASRTEAGSSIEGYNKVSDAQVRAEFRTLCETYVPADLLQAHAMASVDGPEAFLQLRGVCARSFAGLSICSYVLGLGDRHLENLLMGPGGELVSIDFGYSFGMGTTLLPVPETMPFRFTRNLRAFLQPLGMTGQVHYAMVAALNCLRERRDKILDIMAIFANEPLMDWVARVNKEGAGAADQLVKSRVRVAELKLRGVRPGLITVAELASRDNAKSAGIKNAMRLVGDVAGILPGATGPLRFAASPDDAWQAVSVGDQVKELVALATDDAMLARHYLGAKCWL